MGNFIAFMRYVFGFMPMIFLFLCLMRGGLYFIGGRSDEVTPEYNVLRGFIALCFGCMAFGMLVPGGSFGGMLGAIVSSDIGYLIGNWQIAIGILCLVSFAWMAGVLLNIKWSYVVRVAKLVWKTIRWVLSAFHILPVRADDEIAEEEVVEEEAKCEHDFIEANYQAPKTCSICGETEGEKLEAYKEKEASNSKHVLSEDASKVIDMEVVCRNDSSKTSVVKVWMENVNRFDSDEKHQAQEGYEWISADVYWACGDDNSAYGVDIANVYDDYYIENIYIKKIDKK